ncbi:DUF3883 domain-containing protein [Archangium sp. miwbw1]|uniref:DUF3883 domain-containing protein n=3 Tax=Archangium lansingense TaxID=2995310 RepID=A0ABT4A0Q5_9BACT|nr:DUF3883 domain-containing protein [Archangium lansinium]MCY1075230.1 DUF3883 domain-containing protein [Archangium lansinium]
MARDEFFRPGHRYRDKGAPKDPEDQFMRWINLPSSGMANAPGIRPLRYLSRRPFTDLPAFLILVTKKSSTGGSYNPWDDNFDPEHKTVTYWGDAKLHPEKHFTDFPGNRTLKKLWDAVNEGRRDELPPILHFMKYESGWVTFTGLCELTELSQSHFEEKGQRVANYRCQLRILGPDQVPVAWLHSRRSAGSPEEALRGAPASWTAWVQGANTSASVELEADSMEVPWAAEDIRSEGQGFSSDPRIRKAVELEAMRRAREHFQRAGFTRIEDVSRKESFDLHGKDVEREVFIEVKGTQSGGARVLLTSSEVEFARCNKSKMALYVLHSMQVREVEGEVIAEGGEARVYWPWDVDAGTLAPISFSYGLP